MEHIEEAGIHSGDSSCVVPPFLCPERHLATIRDYTRRIARALKVVGLMNVQYATKDDVVYVLEVNPRASRTVPYLSKATGVSLAKVAAKVMAGRTLAELGLTRDLEVAGVFVKSPVFPFVRFPGVDTILGPEMKSTGEVMGGSTSFGVAFAKAQLSVGQRLPESGTAFVSVNNDDKANLLPIARDLAELGFQLHRHARHRRLPARATASTVDVVFKVNEGRPNIADEIVNRKIDLDRQHAARPRVVLRRSRRAPRGDDARGAVHHDADRRRRRRQRHPRAAPAGRRRARAAGLLRRNCRRAASRRRADSATRTSPLITKTRSTRRSRSLLAQRLRVLRASSWLRDEPSPRVLHRSPACARSPPSPPSACSPARPSACSLPELPFAAGIALLIACAAVAVLRASLGAPARRWRVRSARASSSAARCCPPTPGTTRGGRRCGSRSRSSRGASARRPPRSGRRLPGRRRSVRDRDRHAARRRRGRRRPACRSASRSMRLPAAIRPGPDVTPLTSDPALPRLRSPRSVSGGVQRDRRRRARRRTRRCLARRPPRPAAGAASPAVALSRSRRARLRAGAGPARHDAGRHREERGAGRGPRAGRLDRRSGRPRCARSRDARSSRPSDRGSAQSAAIVAAIVIGDRAGLDDEVQRRLQEAGTYHVIAISGGNIAILAGLMLAAFRLAGMLGRVAMLSAIVVLLAYARLVGGGASVDRATLMAVAVLRGAARRSAKPAAQHAGVRGRVSRRRAAAVGRRSRVRAHLRRDARHSRGVAPARRRSRMRAVAAAAASRRLASACWPRRWRPRSSCCRSARSSSRA